MRNNILVRLVAYYVAILTCVGGLFHLFPSLGVYIAHERARQGGRASLEIDGAGAIPSADVVSGVSGLLDPEKSIPILTSLVFAVLVALPVVWVYRWTRPRFSYNQLFAHTLLVVPIAITLVVFLVKGSLALAFSLAGIVAAVRFRTSLDEPMDAVYVFIVIGTGLAAGVQLLSVALLGSIVFNVVALLVWRMNYGSKPVVLDGWQLVEPDAGSVRVVTAGVAPVDGPGSADETERFNALLRFHTTQPQEAQAFVMPLLESRAKKWQLAMVREAADGTMILEYDLRLKKSVDVASFVRELELGAPRVTNVDVTRSA